MLFCAGKKNVFLPAKLKFQREYLSEQSKFNLSDKKKVTTHAQKLKN